MFEYKCRCVRDLSFGNFCKGNVTDVLEAHCSGRHECELIVDDRQFSSVTPCHPELKSYLDVTYRCLTGALDPTKTTHIASDVKYTLNQFTPIPMLILRLS